MNEREYNRMGPSYRIRHEEKEEKETMKNTLIEVFYCFIAVGIVNATTFVFVLCCGCIDNSQSSLALLSALISSFITTVVSIGSICGLQESSKSKSKSKIKFQKHD